MRPRHEFSREALKSVEFERTEWEDLEGVAEAQTCMTKEIGHWAWAPLRDDCRYVDSLTGDRSFLICLPSVGWKAECLQV